MRTFIKENPILSIVALLIVIYLIARATKSSSFHRGRPHHGRHHGGRGGRTVIYGGGWGGYPYNWFDAYPYWDYPYGYGTSRKCNCGTDALGRRTYCTGDLSPTGELICSCCGGGK